ncbi:MAG: sensor histidine kinase [Spirochaetota bacterium]
MDGGDELRSEAEALARERSGTHDEAETAADLATLVHELRVHQIELELQNDELRRAHDVLDSARAEYADLYDEAPVGYFSLDGSAVITRANETFASFVGLPRDRLPGRSVSSLLVPEARDGFLRRFRALFREPGGKSLDARFAGEAGRERVLHLTVHRSPREVSPDGGAGNGNLRVAATDVTDRRSAETRVKELLEQKELLYRELRHRTSNNYQVVLSMLDLQAQLAKSPEVVDALGQARRRIDSMVVVQESLAESQLDARLDVDRYLDDLLGRISSALDPESHVEIVSSFSSGSTDADTASTLGLIVNEVATNAWKHAFAGRESGRLEVSLAREGGEWVLSLHNDVGVASRAPAVDADHHGLGETLVQALAGQLGGAFARDTTAEGTRCTVRLPLGCISSNHNGDADRRGDPRRGRRPIQPPKSGT